MTNGTNLDAAETKHDAPVHHLAHAVHAEAKHEEKHEEKQPAHAHQAHAVPVSVHGPIETHWKALALQMKEKWAALTEDDLKFVDRTKSALLAKIKERTGLEGDTAERQLDALIKGLGA